MSVRASRACRASAEANALLLTRLMAASCERPKLRKVVEEVRERLTAELNRATLPSLHAPQPSSEEVAAMMDALALVERALAK